MADRYRDPTGHRNALISAAGMMEPERAEADELSALLRTLKRQQSVGAQTGSNRDEYIASSIALAMARLDGDRLHARYPQLLPQIVLLGPTQAGKSSIVNGLLGRDLAEVSPLAGFTVHPQGFCWGARTEETFSALEDFFLPMSRMARDALPRDRFDRYALAEVDASGLSPPVPAACIWDTPDFDSVDSAAYRGHLLQVTALADLVILVLSKDKYSDQSVWDMVSLLQPLGHPAVIVLNKVDDRARAALVDSLKEKWRDTRGDSFPALVTMPFVDGEKVTLSRSALDTLADCVSRHVQAGGYRMMRAQRTRALLQRHWSDWLAPVRAEQQSWEQWQRAVDQGIEDALAGYQRDYLNHPHHYETFQRALARLLTLLEVPGVAGVFASTRRVLTWPFRQVSTLGRRMLHRTVQVDADSGERAVLEQLMEHLLLQMQQVALAKREQETANQAWWRDLASIVRQEKPEFTALLRSALTHYSHSFQAEIDRTARELYQRLEARPMVLNSLRATRMTTDAAALAFALHSGGIGIQDFVIAPATLSLTSMLTESALGHYVNRAAEDLKARQLAAVAALFRASLGEPLKALPDRLDDSRHFKLSAAAVERAEGLLAAYG